ncbi:MAG TPA: sulfotransferase [Actinomycetota bacterium]|nr:sulfotransferase [Actinomycetota bacterium]
MADTKVLLIIGRGRSGSTILDNLLGELDGFFSAGELFNVFKRGLVMGHTCGCGRQVASCALWSRAMATALSTSGGPIAPARVVEWQEEVAGAAADTRKLLKVRSAEGGSAALGSYVSVLGRVYAALAEETSERVIVDSSKRPPHAAYMHLVPGITPYFVQLVRDARAVAFSRARLKHTADKAMRVEGAASNAVGWMRRNLHSEAVRRRYASERSLLVRYEDFVAHPQRTLEEIARVVGEKTGELSFVGDKTATLHPNHSVSGNPSRFETGSVSLRIDDEWLRAQRVKDRLTTTALTWPLLLRYGYPLWPAHDRVAEKAP